MSRDRSRIDCRAEIDRRLSETLEAASTDCLTPAQRAITDRDDRWYGQLLVRSHEAMADTADRTPALEAAVAIELLREYYRSRCELLDRITGDEARPPNHDPTPALLSGDYLYTTAYSALEGVETVRLGACFETLTSVSQSMIGAMGSVTAGPPPADADLRSFIDETAGVLGEGATAIGALLADVDDARRAQFETLGRDLGTARRIRITLDPETDPVRRPSFDVDERRLRRHAEQRVEGAELTLRDLSSVADVGALRTAVETLEDGDG